MTSLAIVTGTSSGIGEAVARGLLAKGWRVVGIARRVVAFDDTNYTHVEHDLSDVAPLASRLERVLGPASFARLGLVNCAADPAILGTLAHTDPVLMLRAIAINVVAPVCLMALATRVDRDAPLRIVNVSSGAAESAIPGLGTYGSSKAALRMAGMVFARELDMQEPARDVTILSYSPGVVDTPMQEAARSSDSAMLPVVGMFRKYQADGMLVPPARPAAEIVAYLESDGHARFAERSIGQAS
ncbi:MAG: SDR family NAD(P)-dependent oxidoreductase [Gemmatimonadaceae bacterium]